MASCSEPRSKIKLTLCFCFLLSTPSGVAADGLTFSLPLVLTAVSAAHWLSFFKLLFTGFSLSSLSGLLLSKKNCTSVFLFCFIFFWFSFLKLHKGSRTHAQLPRRPVPPPKPRRSKKGVSRCRLRLPTSFLYSLLWFASLSVSFTFSFLLFQLLLLTQRPGGIFRSAYCSNEIRQLPSSLVKKHHYENTAVVSYSIVKYQCYTLFLSAYRLFRVTSSLHRLIFFMIFVFANVKRHIHEY